MFVPQHRYCFVFPRSILYHWALLWREKVRVTMSYMTYAQKLHSVIFLTYHWMQKSSWFIVDDCSRTAGGETHWGHLGGWLPHWRTFLQRHALQATHSDPRILTQKIPYPTVDMLKPSTEQFNRWLRCPLLIATTLRASHFFVNHWSPVSSSTISFGRDNILLNVFVTVMQRQPPDFVKLVQVLNTALLPFLLPSFPTWPDHPFFTECPPVFLTIYWGLYYSHFPGDALKIFFQCHEAHIHPQWFSLAIGSVWVMVSSLVGSPVTSTQWSQCLDL